MKMQMNAARNGAGACLLLLLLIIVLCFGYLTIPCQGESNEVGRYNAVQSTTKDSAKILEKMEEKMIRGRKMMAADQFATSQAEQVTAAVRATDGRSSKNKIARENYGARFVAFNEDYRGPRHHPPKNN